MGKQGTRKISGGGGGQSRENPSLLSENSFRTHMIKFKTPNDYFGQYIKAFIF